MYTSYTDMFWQAQEKNVHEGAKYRMLALDIVNSRGIGRGYDPLILEEFALIAARELSDNGVLIPFENRETARRAWVSCDPTLTCIVKGDFRGIIVSEPGIRELLGIDCSKPSCAVEPEITAYFEDILDRAADEAAIDFDVHWSHGVFETWEWAEGGEKYALGYCSGQLEEISKTEEGHLIRSRR